MERSSLNTTRNLVSWFLGAVLAFVGPDLWHPTSWAATQSAERQESLRHLLPPETRADGWRMAAEPEFYVPENLWEFINGQAEMYLDYGFVRVMVVDYISRDGTGFLNVEIYLMKSPAHAFGIYAAERSPDESFIDVGVQGYIGENNLNFWKGPYYVKLTSFEETPGLEASLITLAGRIAGNVEGRYREPELFTCFPDRNRVRMSERFVPRNFMGQPFLKDGYRVDYREGEVEYTAFLVQTGSPPEAEGKFRKFQAFLKSRDQGATSAGASTLRRVQKKGRVFHHGVFLGGVFGIEDPVASEKFVEKLINRLRNLVVQPEKT